jgi:hypothetical protein
MSQEVIVYDSILGRGMTSRPEKSSIGRWLSGITGNRPSSISRYLPRSEQLETGMEVARQAGESVVAGGVLGALNAILPGGLDVKKVPIDGAGGTIAMLAAVALADKEYSKDLRNIGAAGVSVFAYRSTSKVVGEKRLAKGLEPSSSSAAISGEKEDPIIAAARRL